MKPEEREGLLRDVETVANVLPYRLDGEYAGIESPMVVDEDFIAASRRLAAFARASQNPAELTGRETMSDTKRTPGQLELSGNRAWSWCCKDRGSVFECCLATGTHVPSDQNEVNAAFLVKAWNCHDDLLAACRDALILVATMQGMPPDVDTIERIREQLEASIAKAT